MKTKFLSIVSLILMMACGKASDGVAAQATASTKGNPEVELISRYNGGDYITATYSFRYMTQGNLNVTRNNWEILFDPRSDFDDYFEVDTVVDDVSFIYDLGQKSCKDIKSAYPDDRTKRPLVWLAYSDADPSRMTATDKALVKEGHCYLSYNNDEDGRVVTLFHVKKHNQHKSAVINEIEVLNDLRQQ